MFLFALVEILNVIDELRQRRVRHLGVLLTLLCFGVVGVSAWLRLAGAGLGCTPWPVCYAAFLDGATYVLPAGGRVIHRVVATSALLLAFYASWYSFRPAPLQPALRQTLFLTGLMLVLSIVGIWSNDPRRIAVNLINLLGGLALVVFSWRIVLAAQTGNLLSVRGLQNPLWRFGLLFLVGTVLLGGLIGASYQATACISVFDCSNTLHLLHRACAVMAVVLLGRAAGYVIGEKSAGPARQRLAGWVLSLLILEALLGVMTVSSGYVLALAIAHNVGAAALLAAVMQLATTPVNEAIQAAA